MQGLRRNSSGKTIVDDWRAEQRAAARLHSPSRSKPGGIMFVALAIVALSGLAVTMQLHSWTETQHVDMSKPQPVEPLSSNPATEATRSLAVRSTLPAEQTVHAIVAREPARIVQISPEELQALFKRAADLFGGGTCRGPA